MNIKENFTVDFVKNMWKNRVLSYIENINLSYEGKNYYSSLLELLSYENVTDEQILSSYVGEINDNFKDFIRNFLFNKFGVTTNFFERVSSRRSETKKKKVVQKEIEEQVSIIFESGFFNDGILLAVKEILEEKKNVIAKVLDERPNHMFNEIDDVLEILEEYITYSDSKKAESLTDFYQYLLGDYKALTSFLVKHIVLKKLNEENEFNFRNMMKYDFTCDFNFTPYRHSFFNENLTSFEIAVVEFKKKWNEEHKLTIKELKEYEDKYSLCLEPSYMIKKVELDGDVVITDPCYLFNNDEHGSDYHLYFNFTDAIWRDTLYGDWGCHLFDTSLKEPVGEFCADSGMVCVCYLKDVLNVNPNWEMLEDGKFNHCRTILKGFKGTAEFIVHKDDDEDSLEVRLEGSTADNPEVRVFTSRQTSL